MNILLILLQSIVSFVLLLWGSKTGYLILVIIIVSIASAVSLSRMLGNRINKLEGITDYKLLSARIDCPVFFGYFFFSILPIGALLYLVIFSGNDFSVWVKDAISANQYGIDFLKSTFNPKSEAVAFIVNKEGAEYIDRIYLANLIGFLSIFFLSIFHSILNKPLNKSYKNRAWADGRKNSKFEDYKVLFILPMFLIAWPFLSPYELITDQYVGYEDSTIYVRKGLLFAISILQVLYPLIFWIIIATIYRSLLRVKRNLY